MTCVGWKLPREMRKNAIARAPAAEPAAAAKMVRAGMVS